MIMDDLIVAEIRRIRQEILESYGGDFETMSRDVMRRQNQGARNVVYLGKKAPQPDAVSGEFPLHKRPRA